MSFTIMRTGIHLVPALLTIFSLPASVQAESAVCDTPQHHQFDFWVGRWDVYRADNEKLVAHSLIEKLYDGCVVRENWAPLAGGGGGSLNVYRPTLREWRQVWTDSSNGLADYSGRVQDGKMVLTGTSWTSSGQAHSVRMIFAADPAGTVSQTGYESDDNGRSWQLRYKFIYRRSQRLSKSSGELKK